MCLCEELNRTSLLAYCGDALVSCLQRFIILSWHCHNNVNIAGEFLVYVVHRLLFARLPHFTNTKAVNFRTNVDITPEDAHDDVVLPSAWL